MATTVTFGGAAGPDSGPAAASASPWRVALRALARDRSAMVGVVILAALAVLALGARFFAPYDPISQPDIVELKNLAPSLAHPFGTDEYSRDVLSRLIYGSRVSLSLAFLSVLVAVTVGTAYGAVAGYFGGVLDSVMMRIVDALLAIPRVLLLIAVAALWSGLELAGLVMILGLTGWFGVSRLVRTLVRSAREDEFVTAARALGASSARVLARHILPQVLSPVLVAATLAIGHVIVIESGLSFLGLGVQEPEASWGAVFRVGMLDFPATWWVPVFAGGAVVITVIAVNLVVDGLQRALSPRPARVR